MNEQSAKTRIVSEENIEKVLAKTESGARKPGGIAGLILILVPIAWSLYQLWIGYGLAEDAIYRPVHLAFAMFLALVAFPAFKNSAKNKIPIIDWLLALTAVGCCGYLIYFRGELAYRSGAFTQYDFIAAAIGLVLLMEAARRTLGLPLVVIAILFLLYTYFGPYIPAPLDHGGKSLAAILSNQWLTTNGVFGIALNVSASVVFFICVIWGVS